MWKLEMRERMMMKMSGFPPGFPPFFLRSLKTALISSNTQFWRGGYVRTSHWGKNRSKGQKWGFGHSVQKLDRPINRDLYRTTCIHEVLWLSWDQCTEQCFVLPVQLLYPFLFSFCRICNSKSIPRGKTFYPWRPRAEKLSSKWMMGRVEEQAKKMRR